MRGYMYNIKNRIIKQINKTIYIYIYICIASYMSAPIIGISQNPTSVPNPDMNQPIIVSCS